MKNNTLINWLLFLSLSLIWGSSFILIKEGLGGLTAFQVAALRIVSAGLVLSPIALRNLRKIPGDKFWFVVLSGTLGSLIPAFLFCLAEEKLDSSLAGVLNALTPIFVILIGAMFFNNKSDSRKITVIIVAFAGAVFLSIVQHKPGSESSVMSIVYVVFATMLYGLNVNMVSRFLKEIPSGATAAIALFFNAIPAVLILIFTGFFNHDFSDTGIQQGIIASSLLGILSTAVASVLFYMLIKKAGPVFSSMVTYAIPIVAIMWGLWYGEKIGLQEYCCFAIILVGVYIANRPQATKA